MKKRVYAIRDDKLECFAQPVLVDNDAVAVRQFGDIISAGNDHIMGKHPGDFALYHLGEYDMHTGIFENLPCPAILARGSDFAKKE